MAKNQQALHLVNSWISTSVYFLEDIGNKLAIRIKANSLKLEYGRYGKGSSRIHITNCIYK